jgi:hypothetical protein
MLVDIQPAHHFRRHQFHHRLEESRKRIIVREAEVSRVERIITIHIITDHRNRRNRPQSTRRVSIIEVNLDTGAIQRTGSPVKDHTSVVNPEVITSIIATRAEAMNKTNQAKIEKITKAQRIRSIIIITNSSSIIL